jgi:aldose 1-epimerase
MVPYANRIAGARFEWEGQAFTLRSNFPPEPHALHGIGWQRGWEVQARDSASVTLGLEHDGDVDWPFAFAASQHIALSKAGLRVTIGVTNRDARNMPAGLGYHPYFLRDAATRMRLAAAREWPAGADGLPGAARDCPRFDGVQWVGAEGSDLDCDLEGWGGCATLVQGDRTTIQIQAPCPWLRLFTPPGQAFVAIEPVTHAANAINRGDPAGLGLVALAPGARLELSIGISAS